MPKEIIAPGTRFSRLIILSDFNDSKYRRRYVVCRCDCGTEKAIRYDNVKHGVVKSCGCLIAESTGARFRKHGHCGDFKRSSEYNTWVSMVQRCENKNDKAYPNYGGRGIWVCDSWHEFENFYRDMGPRPPKLSIDRMDNNGPYAPWNCRWSTQKEQTSNFRRNRILTHKGESLMLGIWAERLGIKSHSLHNRLKSMSVEAALTAPKRAKHSDPRLTWKKP